MIKAILFDMDGVLIDAKEWHYEALNKALNIFGFEITRYQHLVAYDGLPTREKLKMLSKERNLPVSLHAFINKQKQKYTMELIFTKCNPVYAHQYALSKLHKMNYKMAVCSNSIRQSVDVMISKARLSKYFVTSFPNEDVTHSKPDPEMYLLAMKKLQVSPSETIILEDNDNGIKAARASGAYVLVINDIYDVNFENITRKIKEVEHEYSDSARK